MAKYKISWRHVIQESKDITEEVLLKVVEESESRKDMTKKIMELFKVKETYDRTFSECIISEVLIDSTKEGIRQEKILAKGIAILRPGENFARKVGMQVSFIDAMTLIEDREVRTIIWQQYLKNHKIVKLNEQNKCNCCC